MNHSSVAQQVARLIITTELPAGAHLTASGLADRLAVSRTPIREAIRELATLGLVEIHEHRGAFVIDPADIPATQMADLVETRQQLEPWVFGQAALRRDDADLGAIDDALDAGRAAMRGPDVAALNLAHYALLSSMARAAHNRAADIALAPLHYRTCLVFARVAPIVLPTGWPRHAEIRDAIADADAAGAERLQRDHLGEIVAELRAG
ncbi:MAG: GntR family transcriptional regulator [Actinomycetota bacterium]